MAKYTVYRNIYQFATISKIYRDLPLFWYLSLENSSFPWYLSFIKKFSANLNAIFSKNSSSWNSSIQKMVDPYIFPKQW